MRAWQLAMAGVLVLAPALAWAFAVTSAASCGNPVTEACLYRNEDPNALTGAVVARMDWQPTLILTFDDGGTYDASAAKAAQAWNDVAQLVSSPFRWTIQTQVPGSVDLCSLTDGQDAAGWSPDFCGWPDMGDAVGATFVGYWTDSNGKTVAYQADVSIRAEGSLVNWVNGSIPLRWEPDSQLDRPYRTLPDGTVIFDFHRVMLHEIGHAMALGHPDQAGQTVAAIMNSKMDALYTLQEDDCRGLAFLYSDASTDPNACAALTVATSGSSGGGAGGSASDTGSGSGSGSGGTSATDNGATGDGTTGDGTAAPSGGTAEAGTGSVGTGSVTSGGGTDAGAGDAGAATSGGGSGTGGSIGAITGAAGGGGGGGWSLAALAALGLAGRRIAVRALR